MKFIRYVLLCYISVYGLDKLGQTSYFLNHLWIIFLKVYRRDLILYNISIKRFRFSCNFSVVSFNYIISLSLLNRNHFALSIIMLFRFEHFCLFVWRLCPQSNEVTSSIKVRVTLWRQVTSFDCLQTRLLVRVLPSNKYTTPSRDRCPYLS